MIRSLPLSVGGARVAAGRLLLVLVAGFLGLTAGATAIAAPAGPSVPRDIIVDTDIGDDIDDAFALALILRSPELHVVGIAASWGDTDLRARLLRRLLDQGAPHAAIPVWKGPPTPPATAFTQAVWATQAPPHTFPDATTALLTQLRARPTGSVTLIALAPLSTVGALIRRDPEVFRRLREVVVMGGAVVHGYGGGAPVAEYNVKCDPEGLRLLLASGVKTRIMPVDSTEIALGEKDRNALFAEGTPLTDALTLLYHQWAQNNAWGTTPTLFDVVPVAAVLDPSLCPTSPMRLVVDPSGVTRRVSGVPNAEVCLHADPRAIVQLLESRLSR
jgi:inosine-uridine nucleoside N-ribohydrolase